MNASKLRAHVQRAVLPLLADDASPLEIAPAWFVEPKDGTPTLFRARHVHGLAATNDRLFVVRLPHRRAADADDVVVDERIGDCELVRLRNWMPLQQVWLRRPDGRELVLELRVAQRRTGRAIADAARGANRAPLPTDTPEATPSPS